MKKPALKWPRYFHKMSTIFAPITSISKSGICVIRISGPDVIDSLKAIGFKGEFEHQKISFQKIKDPKNNQVIDETLISYFKAPNSFTGEDVAEISIHASPFILKNFLEILSQIKNLRFAENGEFSKRAFLNDKLDLVKAEAIPDLIAAETKAQHLQAMRQLDGKLGEIYESWRVKLIEISALMEAAIDFPDEDLPQNIVDKVELDVEKLKSEIISHLDDNKIGQKIKTGLNLAIIGAPNVGKSSLINFLTKSDIAIVSEIKGTTRDVIETDLSIAGILVKICDTAGLRKTSDKIEAEGIKRALKKAKDSDIKIYMIDDEDNLDAEFQDLIDENTIFVRNKIDLTSEKEQNNLDEDFIKISLTKKINTNRLIEELEQKVQELIPTQNHPAITQERYRVALNETIKNLDNFSMQKNIELASEDLRFAAREIGKIMGKIDVENILDVIFSKFCIGK